MNAVDGGLDPEIGAPWALSGEDPDRTASRIHALLRGATLLGPAVGRWNHERDFVSPDPTLGMEL